MASQPIRLRSRLRDALGLRPVEELRTDSAYALRILRRAPGFAIVAILTLALGIGATAAIFTIVNAVMLRPLPYAEPGRLVGVWGTHVRTGGQDFLSPGSFLDAASLRQIFDRAAGVEYRTFNAITGAGPVRVKGARTSAGLFSMLGVAPIIGRSFADEDDRPDAAPVAMLSDRLWRQQFQADSSWIGKPITLNGATHLVIGVLPPTLHYPFNEPDLFVPLAMTVDEQQRRHTSNIQVFARLAPGVSPSQAQSVLTQLARRSESLYPQYAQWAARVIPLDVQMIASVREGLLILLGAVALVLLIACANIGNLLLVRGAMRRREIAMRLALGASRARVVRQLLTDSLILASLGAVAGLALAHASLRALQVIVPPAVLMRSRGDLTLDGTVVAFTCVASFVAALIFGLAPALRSSRLDLHATLKDASLRASSSPRDRRVRNALVIAEIALSVMLLIGAGLLIVSFWRLQRVDPGFRSDSLLSFRVSLPESKYPDDLVRAGETFVWSGHQVPAFYDALLARLRALPGVRDAAATGYAPLTGQNNSTSFIVEGRPPLPRGETQVAYFRPISPEYFRALGIPLRRGRAFTAQDTYEAPRVAIISETLARLYFRGQDPIGQRIRTSPNLPARTIVGIVGDVKYQGLGADAIPEMYFAYPQALWPQHEMTIVLRTAGDPATHAEPARREVLALDPEQPIYNVQTMGELVTRSLGGARFNMVLLTIFGGLAALLAAVGIYGVMTYAVTQRTSELGLRLALGAERRDVIALVLREAIGLASIGVALGLAGAFAATRIMSAWLFGVEARDPAVFAASALLLTAVAMVASYVPARRAGRVDPLTALRCG